MRKRRPELMEIHDNQAPSPWRRFAPHTQMAFAAVLAAIWMYLSAPGSDYFLRSEETGHQLAGAWNLLHFGQWPQVDYSTSYGPGRYLVSALGLMISQGGLFGELLLRSLFYFLYLLLLKHLLLAVRVPPTLSWLILAAAAVALPPSHKYWTALCPMLMLWAILRFTQRPSVEKAFAIGVALGVAALFRADYALFALVPTLAAFATVELHGQRMRMAAMIFAGVAAMLGPWSIFVALHHNLLVLLADWIEVGAATGVGLSFPHPLLHWYNPSLSITFLLFVTAPLIGLWQMRHLPRGDFRAFALATHLYALVNLVQSSHRADWSHLLQGLSPGLVSIALVLSGASFFPRWSRTSIAAVVLICLGLGSGTVVFAPAEALTHWQAVTQSKAGFESNFLSNLPIGKVARVARRCLPVGTPTVFYPFSPQLHYFSELPFAGDMPYLAPGFFAKPEQQAVVIATLERQAPPALFWNEDYAYDNRPERNSVNTHALLHDYVRSHYTRLETIEGFSVYVRDGSKEALPACLREIP
jgi:hypothetical protein